VGADGKRIRKVTKWASVFKATIASLPTGIGLPLSKVQRNAWAGMQWLWVNKGTLVVEESDEEVLIEPMFAD
jgi:hypothetical protein